MAIDKQRDLTRDMLQHDLLHNNSVYMVGSCHAWLLHKSMYQQFLTMVSFKENWSRQPMPCGNLVSKINCHLVTPGARSSRASAVSMRDSVQMLLLYSYVSILRCTKHVCHNTVKLLVASCVNVALMLANYLYGTGQFQNPVCLLMPDFPKPNLYLWNHETNREDGYIHWI